MRVVFMGTPAFAVPSLTVLARQHEVVGVLTRPDAVRGRGKTLVPSAVKEKALSLGSPVIECSRVTPRIVEQVRALKPQVGCVAAFGALLPPALLNVPAQGFLNVHGSLLPRWRGAAPLARAILAGDKLTGISIMRVEEGLDTGDVCLMEETLCAGKDLSTLSEDLSWMGAYLLLDALNLMESGDLSWTPQDDALATYAPRIAKGELDLSPDLEVIQAWRHVLASERAHPSRALIGERLVRVRSALPREAVALEPGAVAQVGGDLFLGFADGALELREITPAGKGPMAARAWVRGLQAVPTHWQRP